MSNAHGSFAWYELMTTEAAAAEKFYRSVVGWNSRDVGNAAMAYTLFLAEETPAAGVMTLPQEACAAGARPAWVGYIEVTDVDVYAVRVQEAGGAIHRQPADIPGVGRFCVVADPQGASLVLFKSAPEMSAMAAPADKPGYVGWRELMAVNGEAAFNFYSALFGWAKAEVFDMGAMGIYQLFASGGKTIGGMMTKPPSVPVPFWTFYFQVDGIKAAVARVQAGGGKITNGPHQVPTGSWIVQGFDPQGALFSLVSEQA